LDNLKNAIQEKHPGLTNLKSIVFRHVFRTQTSQFDANLVQRAELDFFITLFVFSQYRTIRILLVLVIAKYFKWKEFFIFWGHL